MYKNYKTVDAPSAPPAERVVPETQVVIDGIDNHQPHQHEELEEDAICRCCQDGGHKEDLIVPCGCSGSVKYVHRKCLDKWRTVAPNPEAFRRCEICHTDYIFKKQDETGGSKTWRTIKFILAVTFDFAVVVGIWQVIVLAFTLLAFLISFRFDVANYFPAAVPKIISYYVVGHLGFFFLMGIVGIVLGIVLCIKSCCGAKEDRERDREPYTYSTYPYYDSYWDLNLFMCWYFSPWNMYFYSHDPACTAAACCMMGSQNMNFDNCFNGGGSSDSNDCGAFLAVILVAIVAAVIIFGIFIAVYFFITIGAGILNRRVSILKRKSDLPMYIVVDRRDLSSEALAMATH